MTDTSSDAYRLLCLARYVCDFPTHEERNGFIERWRKNHGDASADKLYALCKAEWAKRNKKVM